MQIANDVLVGMAHLMNPMTTMMGGLTSQIPMIHMQPPDGRICSVRGEVAIIIWL